MLAFMLDRLEFLLAALQRRPFFLALPIFVSATLATWVVGHRAFPYLAFDPDSAAYLFQARLFAEGLLAAPAPPDFGFSPSPHVNIFNGLWYAKYPFGNSLYLTLGVLLGNLWLMPAVATGLTLLLFFLIVRDLFDERVALVALLLGAISPTTLTIGGSLLSQPTSRLSLALFLWSLLRALRGGRAVAITAFGALAGGALGYAFNTRPLPAVVFGVAGAVLVLATLVKQQKARALVLICLGAALPFAAMLALFFAWNAYLTGDPLLLPYHALQQADRMGFGIRGEGYAPFIADFRVDFTPAMAFDRIWRHTLWAVFYNLEGWGAYNPNMLLFSDPTRRFPPGAWIVLLTAVLVVLPLLHRARRSADLFCGLIFVLTLAALVFQYSDHSNWGWLPLHTSYYNEATLFGLVPLAARGTLIVHDCARRWRGGSTVFYGVAVLLLLASAQTNIDFARLLRHWDRYYQGLPGLVASAGLTNAVVFVPNSRNAPVGAFPFVPLGEADVVYFRTGPLPQWRLDNPDWRVPYRRFFAGRQAYMFDGTELRQLDTTGL